MKAEIYDYLPREGKEIREDVFIKEQGFEHEYDETDDVARHVVLFIDDQAVATCRFFKEGNRYMIGRIAVRKAYRGMHLGQKVVEEAEHVIEKEADECFLYAQIRAQGFYEKLGYEPVGVPDEDEGVPHIMMHKHLHA